MPKFQQIYFCIVSNVLELLVKLHVMKIAGSDRHDRNFDNESTLACENSSFELLSFVNARIDLYMVLEEMLLIDFGKLEVNMFCD
jgi:hypothetical protein